MDPDQLNNNHNNYDDDDNDNNRYDSHHMKIAEENANIKDSYIYQQISAINESNILSNTKN